MSSETRASMSRDVVFGMAPSASSFQKISCQLAPLPPSMTLRQAPLGEVVPLTTVPVMSL